MFSIKLSVSKNVENVESAEILDLNKRSVFPFWMKVMHLFGCNVDSSDLLYALSWMHS